MNRIAPILGILLLLLGADAFAASKPLVSKKAAAKRAQDYLEFATEVIAETSILNSIAHMERERVDESYTAPPDSVDVEDWSRTWEKLDELRDTRDFDGLYLLNALLGYEDHPYLTDALWDRIRASLFEFKMWYTDPTPPQPDPDEPARDWDDSYYWTENHQVLYHTIEYLMGQRFPNACFTIRGFTPGGACDGEGDMTGAAHQARAEGFIRRWMEERWEAGYSEWFSNIYYQKDATPLLTLAEFAEDPEIATRATILLDILLFEMAAHTHRNVFGATHGRSAMKDKYRGPTEDTWGISLLLFGKMGDNEYVSRGDAGATLFSRAQRYRLPEVAREAAKGRKSFVARSRQSYPVDENSDVVENPAFPPGHSFEVNEPNFTFWWGLGGFTIWQVVPLSILTGDLYNLWDTSNIRPFRDLRDLLGDPPNLEAGKALAAALSPALAVGILKEVNTYTYRTPEYMLSSAQDYRKGSNAAQVHSWQATFGPEALVFTTHPMNAVQPPSEWIDRDEGEPGYWTGTASQPRSGQYKNVGIHIYSPGYADGGILPGTFDYETMTHAYFPRDQFNEVVQEGKWTFARKGDGYIALYSWRDTEWQDYSSEELAIPANDPTISFDLIAPGGPDNVWIVECGSKAENGSFKAFMRSIRKAGVAVTPVETEFDHSTFDVDYRSPSRGRIRFGWEAPLSVKGKEIPLADYPRSQSPWVKADRGDSRWVLRGKRSKGVLDWSEPSRKYSSKKAR